MLYKIKFNLIAFMVFIVLNSFIVNALGLTLPYNPVNGYGSANGLPGVQTELMFLLQNGAENDVTVKVSIKEGTNIARISGKDEILIPAKTKDIPLPVNIKVPKEAKIGERYLVILYVQTMVPKASGTSLGTGIEQRFYVTIVQPTPEQIQERKTNFRTATGLLIVLVLIAIVFFIKKHKLANNKKKRR